MQMKIVYLLVPLHCPGKKTVESDEILKTGCQHTGSLSQQILFQMTLQPKNLLIIGGGPCGLITLRNCLYRGTFTKVQLVERHDDVGGVWYVHQVLWLTLSLQYRTILEGIKITLLTIVSDGPHLHTLGS